MKKVTAVLALVGTLTLGLAADATIDAQIEKIQNASAAEKVQIMNELKLQLATMSKEQRQEAIARMQAKLQNSGEMTKAQIRERNRVRENQKEATEDMLRAQHMNQNQTGSQLKAMDPDAGSMGPF
ncbi:MAG: hypothetical protein ABFQ64_00290 [Campylobacterota bacterium]